MIPQSEAGTVHASAVAIGATGVLIRGESGSGKSSLALGLIMADRKRRRLVADDRVILSVENGALFAGAPSEIAGLLEVRGQGILPFPHQTRVVVGLVVDIVAAAVAPRMPEPEDGRVDLCGVRIPRLYLPAGIVDGPLRVALAVERLAPVKPRRAHAEKSLALRNRSVEIGRPARKRPRAEI
jgi:serine kinase of HPr protein (carbohydrate metabolism regulator)